MQWIWPILIQQELDELKERLNNHSVHYNCNKILPSGVSPNFAYATFGDYGAVNCLQQVDVPMVCRLKRDICGEDLVRFVSVLEPVKTIGVRNVHAITKSLTVMSQKRRDIKPLLQHNSRNNLIFVPWLQSIDTVYVDGSQESNVFLSSKERTTRQGSVCYMGSEFKYSYARNALKRSKEVSGLCHKLTCSLCSDSKGAKCSRMPDNFT